VHTKEHGERVHATVSVYELLGERQCVQHGLTMHGHGVDMQKDGDVDLLLVHT
jgi:ABC-type tungstate transport system permease subunit